ncbi:outer membrane protein [Altererythrobacter sp. Root672]|uniref:outer membrane protein n=1 Tax=Altererythrobacter sp. Root672 TaxID=1736584 RepID=UPI0007017F8B|nr:porin family protein [Altererythrobacter sp. Root672]KRA81194.1 hypothetical protein ASD76_11450 [Altererythrobacter sp. Root672]
MNSKLFVAAAFAAVIATPAFANPASGPRIEGVVGWDKPSIDGLDDAQNGADGVVFGLGVGYDTVVANALAIGIDAEITDGDAGWKFSDDEDGASLLFGRDLYVGARFTTQASDKISLYAKVGYTNARLTSVVTEDGVSEKDSASAEGFRTGLGAQYLVTNNAYLGTEYRYSNYEAGLSRHQVVATLGWRF